MLGLQSLQQSRSTIRDVLKLVYKQVSIGALITPALDVRSSAHNHVFEVDAISKTLLIGFQKWFENLQERPTSSCIFRLISARLALLDRTAHSGHIRPVIPI